MSSSVQEKCSPGKSILSLSLVFATFATIAILVVYPLNDYDTFWHIANGRVMAATGQIVDSELFSYITEANKTFHNHEWLSQVIMFFSFDNWGSQGLMGFKIIMTLLVCAVFFTATLRRGGNRELAALLSLMAVFAGIGRYEVRPHLFSFLGVVVLGCLLYGFRAGRFRGRMLVFLPVIFTLWNCLHAPVYGLGFLVVFSVAEAIKFVLPQKMASREEGRAALSSRQLQVLWGWVGATFLVLVLNPEGLLTYQYFVDLFSGSNQQLATTAEFTPTPVTMEFAPFWGFLALVAGSLLWSWRRIDLTDLLLSAAFAYLAVKYQRAVPVFFLVAGPVLAFNLRPFLKRQLFLQGPIMAFLLIVALCGVVYWKFSAGQTYYAFGTGISGDLLPVGSTRFVREVNLQGNMFNTDRYGGYLSFWLAPERKIFHYNIPAFFDAAQSYFHRADTVIEQWNITYAIVGYKAELDMFRQAGFVPVYWESPAAVLVRDIPANREIINRYRIRYFRPLISDQSIRAMAANPLTLPALAREIGDYLSFRRDIAKADLLGEIITLPANSFPVADRQGIIARAEGYNESSALLQQAFGILLYQQKKLEGARQKFDAALKLDSTLLQSQINVAYIFYDQQNFAEAEIAFQSLLADQGRRNANALYGLALTHYTMGKRELARQEWQQFLEMMPKGMWADKARAFLSQMR